MAGVDLNGKGHDLGVYIEIPAITGYSPSDDDSVGSAIIRFRDQPVLSESRAANYEPESLLHSPESFNAYSGSEQREWSIEGKFFSRNLIDAGENNTIINVVRSLVMPDYNKSGSPPTPVKLYAYGQRHIAGVPCLVKSYNFDFPNDVDYVVNGQLTIPIVFTLSITLTEQHSVKQLRSFDLGAFRSGEMVKSGF